MVAVAGSSSDEERTDDKPQKSSRSSKIFERFRGRRSARRGGNHESNESDE
jgi:hypothetical protein